MVAFSMMASAGSWSNAYLVFGIFVVVCAALVLRSEFQDVRAKRVIAACAVVVVLAICAPPLGASIYYANPCYDPDISWAAWIAYGCFIPT